MPEFVIDSYAALWRLEKSFRMSKHDLRARPIYHHKRESIDAHLTIVFAALAITRLIEARTGWSIKKFIQTARRYRTIQIRAGNQLLTAADPILAELRDALAQIIRPQVRTNLAEVRSPNAWAHTARWLLRVSSSTTKQSGA
jgi:transposase